MSRKPKEPEKAFLKPAVAGQLVRETPRGKPLAQEGEWKPLSNFWLRRLNMKDVVKVTAPSNREAKRSKKDEASK